ncbi:MAG: methionyl-tRNA formyltransferase [Patescibacteria group bacterium]
MQKLKTVFFGTEKFAETILTGLINSDITDVVLVITQPDKKVGRKQVVEESPVKILAEKNNIPVAQPESLKDYQLPVENLDLNVVAQYGLIIPKKIINFPRYGSINVHGSLLPKYRGASPIQTAITSGETETGNTIMLMDEKMDTGPILTQESVTIDPNDTYPQLADKMAKKAVILLLNTIPEYIEGKITPQPQAGEPTLTKLLSKDDGQIDFNKTPAEIYNKFRGLQPWPGIWCFWNGKRLKILNLKKADKNIEPGKMEPGKVEVSGNEIFVGCKEGAIEILELQPEGKNPMTAKVFLNGYKNIDGAKLT